MSFKKLVLVRHAKSSWNEPHVDDHDRQLNQRGLKNAPEMGLRLKNQGFSPDYVETSSALRAFSTAKIFCQEINFSLERIMKNPNLYLASISAWLEIIGKLNNDYNSVMLFGHNPGITNLVNQVWGLPIDNVPTCGMIILEFEKIKWEKTISVIPKVAEFDFPKNESKKNLKLI